MGWNRGTGGGDMQDCEGRVIVDKKTDYIDDQMYDAIWSAVMGGDARHRARLSIHDIRSLIAIIVGAARPFISGRTWCKVEDIVNEFGDDPKGCLSIIIEHAEAYHRGVRAKGEHHDLLQPRNAGGTAPNPRACPRS